MIHRRAEPGDSGRQPGESAFAERGGVLDTFGEINGAPSPSVTI